jgi:hypothetical protein
LIVVAIVAVVGWIAAPRIASWRLASRRAELATNVAGIVAAQAAYAGAHEGYFTSGSWAPDAAPGPRARPWTGAAAEAFLPLGWAPEGAVRCSYMASAYAPSTGVTTNACSCLNDAKTTFGAAQGFCDVDGDTATVWALDCTPATLPTRIVVPWCGLDDRF